jgi:hypothetical protein
MAKQKTMAEISYGIESPIDLVNKLILDANKIDANPDKYDLFNFFLTAAAVCEWTIKYYPQHEAIKNISNAFKNKNPELLPDETRNWVEDTACLPNRNCDIRRHVYHSMQICRETANASKHYNWLRSSEVKAIENDPKIKSWYQYFFTSRQQGIFIEYNKEYYSVDQITKILAQFYMGLMRHIGEEVDIETTPTAVKT